jgi:hypothetical protein
VCHSTTNSSPGSRPKQLRDLVFDSAGIYNEKLEQLKLDLADEFQVDSQLMSPVAVLAPHSSLVSSAVMSCCSSTIDDEHCDPQSSATTKPAPTKTQLLRAEENRLRAIQRRKCKENGGKEHLVVYAQPLLQHSDAPLHGLLPSFIPVSTLQFAWGEHAGVDFQVDIHTANDDVVVWRKNLFTLPSGSAGKVFVDETSRLLATFTPGNPLERLSLKAVAVMTPLLLQKPHAKFTMKENDG